MTYLKRCFQLMLIGGLGFGLYTILTPDEGRYAALEKLGYLILAGSVMAAASLGLLLLWLRALWVRRKNR